MAWGEPWPHHFGEIDMTKITHDNNAAFKDFAGLVDGHNAQSEEPHLARPVFNRVDSVLADVRPAFQYKCLTNIVQLKECLGLTGAKDEVLVVLRDYELLREAMQRGISIGTRGFVLTGHPGIGSYDS